MALHLISSNRVEHLQTALALALETEPPPSPFQAEQIIVPGMAMARWLNLQLARSTGVAANIRYRLPAHWIWELAHALLPDVPEQDPLERENATWRLYALLPECLDQPAFAPLQHYLGNDLDGVRRWQLAGRIADVFERYQFYRPEWIRAWSDGLAAGPEREHPWQPILWRALVRGMENRHRVALIDRLPEALEAEPERVPRRISLFAVSSLPPLFVDVFRSVARHADVLFFQHSPTDQYWADLVTEKRAARQRLETPDHALYTDTGDELLVSWGRQGQAFQDLLLDSDMLDEGPRDLYQAPGQDRLLHQLQQRLFDAGTTADPLADDESLTINICHSPLRECQVLHDRLLREMQRDPTLKPEDILVMIPEVSRYAPYVEAVFRRDEADCRPFIPWNLSDISIADERPLLRVFLQLLSLPESRVPWSEVMSLLEVPEVAARFGLGSAEVDDLAEALQSAQARWGLDGDHRRALGLPGHPHNTWQHAMDRLMAAYALGPLRDESDAPAEQGMPLWHGVAAAPALTAPVALGRFASLLDQLRVWRRRLTGEQSAGDWQETVNELLEAFFRVAPDADDPLQAIRDTMDRLPAQTTNPALSGAVLRLWLEQQLGTVEQRGRYFSGGVTFCGMRPMRSMPFRIICLLGMGDQVFPRRDRPAEFDGMAEQWRPGDPRKGDEDRYLMLESLLSARDSLHISYTGRSLQDNEPRQPSTLVQELIDQLRAARTVEPGGPASPDATVHTMQPFSADNFRLQQPVSHDRFWCAVASDIASPSVREPDAGNWPEDRLPLPEGFAQSFELSALRRFLRHPVQAFFNDRLKIRFEEGEQTEDTEPFTVEGLQAWQLRQRLLQASLNGRPLVTEVLTAEGLLPHGALAPLTVEHLQQRVDGMLEAVSDYRDIAPETLNIALLLPDGSPVQGQVKQYYAGLGILSVTPSSLKGEQLLQCWLDHLAACAGGYLRDGESTLHVVPDRAVCFGALPPAEALEGLQRLVALYHEGMQRPLPVARQGSYAAARKINADDAGQAREAARRLWSNAWGKSDSDDAYLRALIRAGACPPHEAAGFEDVVWQFYGDVAAALPGGKLP